jgi:transketolase
MGRIQHRDEPRVFVLSGDREFDEGSNYEVMSFTGRTNLDRLTVMALDDGTAGHGRQAVCSRRVGRSARPW